MSGIEVRAGGRTDILTREALDFVASLDRTFRAERARRLSDRQEKQRELDRGGSFRLLQTAPADWTISPVPSDLIERKVEITGPVEQKMMINALNSGASVFMADFEDAHQPDLAQSDRGSGQRGRGLSRASFVSRPRRSPID